MRIVLSKSNLFHLFSFLLQHSSRKRFVKSVRIPSFSGPYFPTFLQSAEVCRKYDQESIIISHFSKRFSLLDDMEVAVILMKASY